MRWFKSISLAVLAMSALWSCGRETNEGTPAEVREFSPAKQTGLVFDAPNEWIKEEPPSRMRRAQYRLPKVEGDKEDAELVVFYFGGSGGSVDANLDRWIGMFTKEDGSPATGDSKVSKKTVNGLPVTIVDVSGTYNNQTMAPMTGGTAHPSGPKQHFRLLAAIVETETGPWFIRLTGPEKTVGKWEKSFHSFVESLKQS